MMNLFGIAIAQYFFLILGSALLALFIHYNPFSRISYTSSRHSFNRGVFNKLLTERLFGQTIAQHLVVTTLHNHLTNSSPDKPLVMTFHGWTGSGKSHLSGLIADYLFTGGLENPFVHVVTGNRLPPSVSTQEGLQAWLDEAGSRCGRSLFIFDGIREELMRAVAPYLGRKPSVNETDFRGNIFIFLSMKGAKEINRVALKFRLQERDREEITVKDLHFAIAEASLAGRGQPFDTRKKGEGLVDATVPFLPLERHHVALCVEQQLLSRAIPAEAELVDRVAGMMVYVPKDLKVHAVAGCKTVDEKIDRVLTA